MSVTLTHSLGGFQAWNLTVSPDVLAVENLQNNGVTGAEAIQYRERGEIQATPVVGMSRAQRTRLYLRNGGKVLFWHDGWGAPFNLDEMGTFRDYAYRRNLLENKKPMLLRWEIETPEARPLQPAPAFLPSGSALANLFEEGQPLHFDLAFTPATQERLKMAPHWRVTWSARDFFDHAAGQGTLTLETSALLNAARPDKSLVATVELPRAKIKGRGWFSLTFALAPVEKVTPDAAPSEFRTRFGIVETAPGFASNALPAQTPSDYGYAALLGMKCVRESHNMREYFPERGKINWKPLDEVMEHASSEAKKYGVTWFFQANERPDWCSEADYEQIAFEMVSRCKDRCKTWEVENEPNFRYKPADYVTKALVPFAKGAKRADPSCTIIGPACVSVPLTLQFIQAIKEADALKYLDGVSTHTYMGPGESWELFGNPLYLQKLQEMAGNRPLWQTEQGYNWGQSSKQEHARYVARQFLNGFGAGIANTRHNYFYPVHNGFEPWYLIEGGFRGGNAGTPEPAAVGVRVMNAQTSGRTSGRREQPFPGVFQLRLTAPTGSAVKDDVIALWTLDFAETVTLDGPLNEVFDFMGNPVSVRRVKSAVTHARNGLPANAHATLALNGFPVYAHLPRGAKLTVTGEKLGTNYASVSQGATASAFSEDKAHPAAHAIDDRWTARDDAPGIPSRTYWDAGVAGATEAKPVWLQITLPQPRTLDHALLLTPLPAVDGGTPRDYALQVSEDGANWHTVAAVKDWGGWSNLLAFAPVKTRHVRLLVTRLNDGWHLDGKWMFLVSADFKRYTSMQCRVLELQLYGPTTQK